MNHESEKRKRSFRSELGKLVAVTIATGTHPDEIFEVLVAASKEEEGLKRARLAMAKTY